MKKFLALLLLSLLLFTGCGKKEKLSNLDKVLKRDTLIVGIKTDSKPFGFISKSTKEPAGFDIDVAKYIAQDMLGSERKIKFVSVTPSNRIETLATGQVDIVVATMTITPQRQCLIDFTKPYFLAGQTAIVRKDSKIYTFADLKDKTIIVVLGSTAESNLRRILPTAKIIGYKNYDEAFNAFHNGVGEALSSDNTILSGYLIDYDGYRILKNKITKEAYAIGLQQTENDNPLKKSIDIIITRMHKDGTLKQLKRKWMVQ